MARCLLLFLFVMLSFQGTTQSVDHVEPPFWWTGMKDPFLQLMIHGEDIGTYNQVNCLNKGIKILESHQADSPNYLFVHLSLDPLAKAGKYTLVLTNKKGESKEITYELKQRDKDSATREGFNSSDVIYLIMPDRFANGDPSNDEVNGMREGLNRDLHYGRHGGDLKGIEDNLDYFKNLGITTLWLNPVLENDMEAWSYHGYSTTDYYKIDPRLGSNEDFKRLTSKASDLGIKMVMDQIANHCGSFHWWMEDKPFEDWIHPYRYTNHRKRSLRDPYTTQIDREIMVQGWFDKTMPDLNQHNPFMALYLIHNSIWWIEYSGLTGIRQDTYGYPYADFMEEWTCAIMNEYPNFNIVGEEWLDTPSNIAYIQEGYPNTDGYSSCLPSVMDFPMMFNLDRSLNEEEKWDHGLEHIYRSLTKDYNYPDPNQLVIFADNHDGSRIFTKLNEDPDLTKMAMAYIFTMRGIPQIFYGTEILMSNKDSDEHGIIRSDFPGGWTGDSTNAFTSQALNTSSLDFLSFTSKLLNWRKNKSVIHNGELVHFVPENGVYSFFRFDDSSKVWVILNKNLEPFSLGLSRYSEQIENYSKAVDVISGDVFDLTKSELELKPKRAYILELN